jgi:hypothetical protein
MKSLHLILFQFFCVCVTSAQTIDSVKISRCISIDDFTDTTRTIVVDSFDTNGLLLNEYIYDTSWNFSGRIINSYTSFQALLYSVAETYDDVDTAWYKAEEILNQYDQDDSLLEWIRFRYSWNAGVLQDTTGSRLDYQRDTVNHVEIENLYQYIDSANVWDTTRSVIEYGDSLDRITKRITWFPGASGYLEVYDSLDFFYLSNDSIDYTVRYLNPAMEKEQRFYNGQGYLFRVIDSVRSSQAQPYEAQWVEQYDRDSLNNVVNYSMYYFIDSLGNVDSCGEAVSYQYNSFNQEIFADASYCGGGGWQVNSTYDPFGILIHWHRCSWGSMGSQHCKDCDYEYYTSPFSTEIVNNSRTYLLEVYPNPAGYSVSVSSVHRIESIRLFTVFGEALPLHLITVENIATVDLKGLRPSLYLLEVKTKAGYNVVKLIVSP